MMVFGYALGHTLGSITLISYSTRTHRIIHQDFINFIGLTEYHTTSVIIDGCSNHLFYFVACVRRLFLCFLIH